MRSGSSAFNRWTKRAGPTALFVALTALMTWPQVRVLGTHAADHHDVFFNLWRLRWIAHALASSPGQLFDGNVFYPSRLVLAFSDAMLVQGVLAAPLFWLGLPPVLVHNLMLLGAIVASGVGMFVLAKHLSGSSAGAVVAGIVYSFAPYRFEHYMHMELQWAVWLPWAFWALQRTIETGAAKYGALTGVFAALQLLSSMYYAAFLALLLPAVAVIQLIPHNRRDALAILRGLVIGAMIAGGASAMYATPYTRTSARVGVRSETDVMTFSAKPKDYLAATSRQPLLRRAIAWTSRAAALPWNAGPAARPVRPVAADTDSGDDGLSGLRCHRLRALAGNVRSPLPVPIRPCRSFSIDASTGARIDLRTAVSRRSRGARIRGHFPARPFDKLRAVPSRSRDGKGRWRLACAIVLIPLLLAEYWVAPVKLVPYQNQAPALYSWLARQPPGIVAEFPMPNNANLPGRDAVYSYMSTFHWKPLLNGYSGYYPRSYLARLDRLEKFPDFQALESLRDDDVTYVIVHADTYTSAEFESIVGALTDARLRPLGRFNNGNTQAAVFSMR